MKNPQPCTKQELAEEMRISLSTLQRMLKKEGLRIPRGLIAPETKNAILDRLKWHHKTRNDPK
jgi:predicted transcriptional regulator